MVKRKKTPQSNVETNSIKTFKMVHIKKKQKSKKRGGGYEGGIFHMESLALEEAASTCVHILQMRT